MWRGKPAVWPHAITAFFYVGNYYQAVTGEFGTPLFHTWSLSIEEQYYLLWPAAFIALKTNEARLRALLIAIPCFWAYRLALVGLGIEGPRGAAPGGDKSTAQRRWMISRLGSSALDQSQQPFRTRIPPRAAQSRHLRTRSRAACVRLSAPRVPDNSITASSIQKSTEREKHGHAQPAVDPKPAWRIAACKTRGG